MSEPVKSRRYHSPKRAALAEATRRRVLEAATALFLEQGYAATTVAAVGRRAGVAADTVLHRFGSKRGLLQAVMDTVVGGDDADVPVLERAGPQRMRAETDQRVQLAMFAAGITVQLERIRPLDDILRSAAAVDAEVAALRADLQLRQRRAAMRAVVGWVAANGPLRRPADEAADEVWTLTSPDVHRLLRVDCGWSAEAYTEWLRGVLVHALLP